MKLPDAIYDRIEDLSEAGSNFFDQSRYGSAIQQWSSALALLPQPPVDWEAYTWLSASIGDAHYQLNQLEAARQSLLDALNGPGGTSNPFIHYRLGQCLTKLGHADAGIQSLLQAYMLDGEQIFSIEPEGAASLQQLRARRLI